MTYTKGDRFKLSKYEKGGRYILAATGKRNEKGRKGYHLINLRTGNMLEAYPVYSTHGIGLISHEVMRSYVVVKFKRYRKGDIH